MITALNEFSMNYKGLKEKCGFWVTAIVNLTHFPFPTPNGFGARPIPEIPPAPLCQRGVGGISEIRFQIDFAFGKTGKQVPIVKLIGTLKSLPGRDCGYKNCDYDTVSSGERKA